MRYWLGLGTNLGDRPAALQAAVDALAAAGLGVEAVSAVYETAPRELEDQPAFLNAAVRVHSALRPPALLAVAKRVEVDLGRVAGPRFGPRAIDVDLLVWEGGEWHEAWLDVPHPRLEERRFALVPLLELAPPGAARLAEVAAGLDPVAQSVVATAHRIALPQPDVSTGG